MAEKNGRYKTILMFGQPGSGKGTQGKVLGSLPGFYHLSCGDVFRSLDPESELGKTFLEFSSKGKLVPDNFTVQLWLEHAHGLVHTGAFKPEEEVLILDGIPRNRSQAEMMEEHIDVVLLVCLEAANQEDLVARMRRRALHENRLDDTNVDVIRQRFSEYAAETAPVLGYYPRERIRTVDGGLSPIGVLQGVVDVTREVFEPSGS